METKAKMLPTLGWLLSAFVFALAFIAWGQGLNWQFSGLTAYKVFPLLGLTAFSLMLIHYVIAATRKSVNVPAKATKSYFDISGVLVLLAILAHPGLLIIQLYRDGFGLPPASYLDNYVAEGAAWAALLGTVSFVVFLTYELRFKFRTRSWWKFVQYASDIAMVAIFIHALRLGRNIQSGWFRYVWFFYGLVLILSLVIIYMPTKFKEGDTE